MLPLSRAATIIILRLVNNASLILLIGSSDRTSERSTVVAVLGISSEISSIVGGGGGGGIEVSRCGFSAVVAGDCPTVATMLRGARAFSGARSASRGRAGALVRARSEAGRDWTWARGAGEAGG